MNRSMQRRAWGIAVGIAGVVAAAVGLGRVAVANPEQVVLTETGKRLEAEYAGRLKTLRAEIATAVPALDAAKLATLAAARGEVAKATAVVLPASQDVREIQKAEGAVWHAKGKWLGGAENGIAKAKAALEKATTDAERDAANAELDKWQKDKEAGLKALAERQAKLDALKADESKHLAALEAAKAALAAAEKAEFAAARAVLAAVDSVLSSDALDAKLIPCAVIAAATPEGLAEFAQQGATEEGLVRTLLADTGLMREMLEAGGANGPSDGHERYGAGGGGGPDTLRSRGARYGDAMRIYTAINAASPRSKENGVLHRLALGTALQLALPLGQRNAVARTDGPAVVDPVQRYRHYEKAYLDGELDEAFPTMSTWECGMIVNSSAPDHVLAWGREMLRNYRPDHILTSDRGWRYAGLVQTDVAYRNTQFLKDDPALDFFQNVCKEGGICGRRGFFGRFICQAFGVPAASVRQPGHCALAHWTPQGWVINLGGGWDITRFGSRPGPDFLLEAQAREHPQQYRKVLRARWIGTALGEAACDPVVPGTGGPWNQIALFETRSIVADAKPAELAALGKELGEANASAETRAQAVAKAVVTDADRTIAVGADGTITIPAAACTGGNSLVKSFLGGQQMIFGGDLGCEVEVPAAGRYALSARVATMHDEQRIPLTAGAGKEPAEVVVPFTLGAWKTTPPVEVTLTAGRNALALGRPGHAFAVKEITLTPVK